MSEYPSDTFVQDSIQDPLGGPTRGILPAAGRVQTWYASRVAACRLIAPEDATRLRAWVEATIEDGRAAFGAGFSAAQTVITAMQRLDDLAMGPDADWLRRADALRAALTQHAIHLAQDDALHAALFRDLDAKSRDAHGEIQTHALLALLRNPDLTPAQAYRAAYLFVVRAHLGHAPKTLPPLPDA